MTRIGLHGAGGRMGAILVPLILESPDLSLALATERPDHPRLGQDLGTVLGREPLGLPLQRLSARDGDKVEVFIDFSLPTGTAELLAALPGVPLVTGTTGLDPEQKLALNRHARGAPTVAASNYSLGIAILTRLAREAARLLPDYDLEIVEMHHRRKRDAPSGTALSLARAMAEAREQELDELGIYGRLGETGPRPEREIAIHALRGGDIVGEHTIRLAGPGEHLSLGHVATSREALAQGALRATRWVVSRPPGLYSFEDVISRR